MKQNLAFLGSVVGERPQPLAVREVIKAFLVVLLAGGSGRAFSREDHGAVAEDFAGLKRMFCSCSGDGLVTEEVVETETAAAQGVVDLMASPTGKLIEEFCRLSGGTRGMPPGVLPFVRRHERNAAGHDDDDDKDETVESVGRLHYAACAVPPIETTRQPADP